MDNDQNCEHGLCHIYPGKTRPLFIALAVFLSLFLFAKALHEFKLFSVAGRNIYPTNVITITGEGKATAVPNIASFTYSVVEEAANVSEALRKATEKSNRALSYLKENGITDKDIKTINYNTYPKYEPETPCTTWNCPPSRQVIRGYEVSQSVQVKVRKTDDAGKILGGLGSLEVSNVSGLSFTVDDEATLKADARKKAITDAEEKAEILSKELGVKIIRVVSFFEEGQFPQPFYGRENAAMGMGGDTKVSAVAPQFSVGENELTSRVTVTYEIK